MAKGGQIPFRVAAPPCWGSICLTRLRQEGTKIGEIMFTSSTRIRRVLATAPVAAVLFAAPAHAYMDARYSDKVRVTASGSTLKAYDTSCDGRGAQANWQRTGSSTVFEKTNGEGCGTVLQFTTGGTVTQIRACLVIPAQKDPCSAWTSRQY